MSLPQYPQYKDSGIEWLGQVPAHWDVVQFKQFVEIQNGTDHKHVEQADGYPVLGSGGVFAYASDYLYDGESVLLGRKGTIDKPLHVTGRFWTVDTMYWTKISREASGRFTYYAALTIPFDYYSTNTALPSMTKGALNGHLVARPPLREQTAIAAFLDRETVKIDALVAEQERLIELLKEQRQAVISHAVTKGLNPDVPMKESGIEWLGEIPKHWSTTQLKYATSIIVDCPHETPVYSVDGPYLVIRTADLDRGIIKTEGMYRVSENEYTRRIRRQALRVNDIVYGREGERWGHAGLVVQDDTFCLGQRMMQFRARAGAVIPSFLMWQLNARTVYVQGELDTVGATAPHVNVATIRNYFLALPPPSEQGLIADYLTARASSFDTLIAEAQRAIALLQERRTALISAAVTGQIDVRETAGRAA